MYWSPETTIWSFPAKLVVTLRTSVLPPSSGVNIHGRDNTHPSQPTRRIVIRNNLFVDIGGPRWGGEGRLFQIVDGTSSIVIDHNTPIHIGNIITAEGPPHHGFVFTDHIVT